MTHDENEFTYGFTPIGEEGAVATLVTVRHLPSGEERSVVVPAEEVIGQNWIEVTWSYATRLRASLGYVEPEHYGSEEFVFYQSRCGDSSGSRWGAIQIVHKPSGISSGSVRLDEARRDGKSSLTIHAELMGSLTRSLREAGIKPQPPPVARKKLGKPRWKDKAPKDGEQA